MPDWKGWKSEVEKSDWVRLSIGLWTQGHEGRVIITQVRQGESPWRTCSIRIASRVKDGCGPSLYQASWDTELLSSTVKV